jgi:predicted ABC-type ATPase
MQWIIILAGPNGAGKTSFANEYLPAVQEDLLFLNADETARRLAATGHSGSALDVAAGREMLTQMDLLAQQRAEFMLETTLATMTYAKRIPTWRQNKYWISLIYLRLPSVEASIARVRKRVQAGGHAIPEDVIRRRFARSLMYLERVYKPLVNDWHIWDSLDGDFKLAESQENAYE